MTNRPPPTQASPFVVSILRPLKEFDQEFSNRTPERVGSRWKQQIVVATDRRLLSRNSLQLQRTSSAQSRNPQRLQAVWRGEGLPYLLTDFFFKGSGSWCRPDTALAFRCASRSNNRFEPEWQVMQWLDY
jgi:hypothetical protein